MNHNVTPEDLSIARIYVEDHVHVHQDGNGLFYVWMSVGVQNFRFEYHSEDRKHADAFAELVRKGLAYMVAIGSMRIRV